jgi:hypothetical protein
VHVENQTGSAQYAGAQPGWYSAHWQFSTTSGRVATEGEQVSTDAELGVETFPNPASGKSFHISISGIANDEAAQLTLRNVNGGIALQRQIKGSEQVDHNLQSGLYIMDVRSKHGRVVKKMLITE